MNSHVLAMACASMQSDLSILGSSTFIIVSIDSERGQQRPDQPARITYGIRAIFLALCIILNATITLQWDIRTQSSAIGYSFVREKYPST